MHTLTRESQEVEVGETLVRKFLLLNVKVESKRSIVVTDIPVEHHHLNSLHSSIVWCSSEV